jgi:hypothetical protein
MDIKPFYDKMKRKIMATKLNKRAFEHAKNLISSGKCVRQVE